MDNTNRDPKELILEKQLGKTGRNVGAIGGFIGGGILSGITGAMGGQAGAQWAASKLKTQEYTTDIVYKAPLGETISSCYDMLQAYQHLQQLIDCDIDSDAPYLCAVVGSGFGNMNSTIVCLEFVPLDDSTTTVYISAAAKEGLIKQKSSEKACTAIAGILAVNS